MSEYTCWWQILSACWWHCLCPQTTTGCHPGAHIEPLQSKYRTESRTCQMERQSWTEGWNEPLDILKSDILTDISFSRTNAFFWNLTKGFSTIWLQKKTENCTNNFTTVSGIQSRISIVILCRFINLLIPKPVAYQPSLERKGCGSLKWATTQIPIIPVTHHRLCGEHTAQN